MRNNIITLIALLTVFSFIQCSPKVAKNTTSISTPTSSNQPTKSGPIATSASELPTNDPSTEAIAKIKEGNRIYSTSCKKCHELYNPSSRTAQEWKPILVVMTDKAKLSEAEKLSVSNYIYSSCKK